MPAAEAHGDVDAGDHHALVDDGFVADDTGITRSRLFLLSLANRGLLLQRRSIVPDVVVGEVLVYRVCPASKLFRGL